MGRKTGKQRANMGNKVDSKGKSDETWHMTQSVSARNCRHFVTLPGASWRIWAVMLRPRHAFGSFRAGMGLATIFVGQT